MIVSLLTGGGFALLTRGLEMFGKDREKARERDERGAERAHELALIEMNEKVRRAEAESEHEAALIHQDSINLNRSYEHAIRSQTHSYKWVGALLSMVRPALTLGLVGTSVYLVIEAQDPQLTATATVAILDLTGLAIGWWFGDRSFKRMSTL